jgi:hypothetical protein
VLFRPVIDWLRLESIDREFAGREFAAGFIDREELGGEFVERVAPPEVRF